MWPTTVEVVPCCTETSNTVPAGRLTCSTSTFNHHWIVADPQLLGGKLAVRGTRLSVSLILECLAGGMSLQQINDSFEPPFRLRLYLKF
jgi:uncharacterized protein (DUF433 family)